MIRHRKWLQILFTCFKMLITGWLFSLTSESKVKQGGPGTSILTEEGRDKLLTLRYPAYSGQ